MSEAGYDPNAAVAFWQRMERAASGGSSEFLSTHPSHETRENQIREWLPEAQRYLQAASRAPVEHLPGPRG
jgi:predicted Zn-dependent protease